MILFAKDLVDRRVYIDDAVSENVYYCEECGTKLIAKNKGTEKHHHFAHVPDENNKRIQKECIIRNEQRIVNQMSDWHQAWQSKYPKNQREVVFSYNGKICRADVYLPATREVVEFQHSKISREDFHARNNFYTSLGLSVIWLFDFDTLYGKYKYLYPDQYDEFVQDYIRKNQKVYNMDHDTYTSIFGTWKPHNNRKVRICFMETHQNWNFYYYIASVTGSFNYNKPMRLFVIGMKEKSFMKRIGIKK